MRATIVGQLPQIRKAATLSYSGFNDLSEPMHWRLKAGLQNVVARLPFSDHVYYAIQRGFGSLRPGRHDPRPWYEAAADLVKWVGAEGLDVRGRTIVEIGTGRRLDLPTALWLHGAARIVTVDVHRYLSGTLVAESLRTLPRHRERIEAWGPEAGARLSRLLGFGGGLDELLAMCGIEYLAPVDTSRLPLASQCADLVVTHVVLQNVPPPGILGMLAEARRVLAPGGLVVHFIDLTDMFSHDGVLPAIHFLQFGAADWDRTTGSRFMYQNRLRASDYLRLFEQAGLRVLRSLSTVDEPSLALLRSGAFRVAPELANRPLEDLAGSHLRVLGTFDPPAPSAARRVRAPGLAGPLVLGQDEKG